MLSLSKICDDFVYICHTIMKHEKKRKKNVLRQTVFICDSYLNKINARFVKSIMSIPNKLSEFLPNLQIFHALKSKLFYANLMHDKKK